MGRLSNNKSFIQTLRQMFNETKQWGSVTVTFKRLFEENFKSKASKKKERAEDRLRQVEENKEKPFSILVRAKNSRKSSSTNVTPEDMEYFYKEIKEIMNKAMSFEGTGKKREQKEINKYRDEHGEGQNTQIAPTKNRSERRKEIRRAKRKELKKQLKEQRKQAV
ncbi:unnamed protein product [Moneuplotes crassus]|uniref:Uncharacterized protein n=1 Tax=Euplotes crassus TaxID=5936 RepID=A0AAD1XVS1_EUPCR|nr:unnamed protein product [Moneuplotes crassus]